MHSDSFMPYAACRTPPLSRLGWLLGMGVLLVSLTSCGYRLVGTRTEGTVRRLALAVPPLINQSREPGLSRHMTAALRRAISQSYVLSLVAEETAPRRLQSIVRRFRVFAISFDAGDSVVQYRIETDTQVRLVESTSDVPLLNQDISAWAEYLVSTTGVVRENVIARDAALFRLAQQFADKCTTLLEVTLL